MREVKVVEGWKQRETEGREGTVPKVEMKGGSEWERNRNSSFSWSKTVGAVPLGYKGAGFCPGPGLRRVEG